MKSCLFCKIINEEIPCNKVYEDDKILAFRDIKPEAPVHIVIIPKIHIESLNELSEQQSEVISHIFLKTKVIAEEQGIKDSGYRVVNNCGEHAGQTVQHIHFHILGGREFFWPPG